MNRTLTKIRGREMVWVPVFWASPKSNSLHEYSALTFIYEVQWSNNDMMIKEVKLCFSESWLLLLRGMALNFIRDTDFYRGHKDLWKRKIFSLDCCNLVWRQWTEDCGLRTPDCGLWTADCRLRTANFSIVPSKPAMSVT